MYIHIGEEILVKTIDVIAIFDFQIIEESKENQLFIDRLLEEKRLIDVGEKESKSVIITNEFIYFSSFSPSTLKKRSEMDWQQATL